MSAHSSPADTMEARTTTPAPPRVGVIRGRMMTILEADDVFLEITGYTREDLEAGRLDWQRITPPEHSRLDEALVRQAVRTGGFSPPGEKEYVRKDGSRVRVLVCAAYLDVPTGLWLAYVVDLDSIGPPRPAGSTGTVPLDGGHAAELHAWLVGELIRERTLTRTMLDHADALIWAVDPEYRLIGVNETQRRVVRLFTGSEMQIGDSALDLSPTPEIRAQWQRWYDRALAGERFVERTDYAATLEGGLVYDNHLSPMVAPGSGRIVGVTVVSQDVTARTRAERALATSEAQFRTLAAASPLGIFMLDREGNVVYSNPRMAVITGVPTREVSGPLRLDLIHPEDATWAIPTYRELLTTGREFEGELRVVPRPGVVRTVVVKLAPVRDGSELTGWVGTVDDVTEQRETALRSRQREKMESLGTLAGGIAHDFNNMLSVVLGFADLALDDLRRGVRPAELEAQLREIRTASLRARDLVRQILAFSRQRDQAREPVELSTLVEESLRLLRATLPPSVRLEARIAKPPLVVIGDASALQQVLVNLCTNAEHAMRGKGGGVLGVTLDRGEPAEGSAEGEAVITVSDSGTGMSPEVRARIFEPFFTTKPVGEGTGMGLSVAHGIVTAHGGQIMVDSTPGEGTTFRIVLPQAPVEAPSAPAATDPTGGAGRVLLAEDEAAVARFAEIALTRAGFSVVVARDGIDAMQHLAGEPDAYDAIVTDISMPGMAGDAVLRVAQRMQPGAPVILMTGYHRDIDAVQARAMGAWTLLEKPVDAQTLTETVREAIAARRDERPGDARGDTPPGP